MSRYFETTFGALKGGAVLNGTNLRLNLFCELLVKNLLACDVSLIVFNNTGEQAMLTDRNSLTEQR